MLALKMLEKSLLLALKDRYKQFLFLKSVDQKNKTDLVFLLKLDQF